MTEPIYPWSAPIALTEIAEGGAHVRIEASASERDAIARLAGVRALPRLCAEFHVVGASRGRWHVTGRVTARVGQDCVVTLEPLENEVDEAIDVFFAPEDAVIPAAPPIEGSHQDGPDDPPEPIRGNRIDLGHLATEWLILGIDPYPRKADAAFEPVIAGEDPRDHPFAALARLKSPDSGANPGKKPAKAPRK